MKQILTKLLIGSSLLTIFNFSFANSITSDLKVVNNTDNVVKLIPTDNKCIINSGISSKYDIVKPKDKEPDNILIIHPTISMGGDCKQEYKPLYKFEAFIYKEAKWVMVPDNALIETSKNMEGPMITIQQF